MMDTPENELRDALRFTKAKTTRGEALLRAGEASCARHDGMAVETADRDFARLLK